MPRPAWWPTLLQDWLLKAALFPGARGLAAWQEWQRLVGDDWQQQIAGTSIKLIPKLYVNLKDQLTDTQMIARLKTAFLIETSKSRQRVHGADKVIALLQAQGIPTLILKGVALLPYYVGGGRIMQDFDVMVPTRQREAAVRTLEANGWALLKPISPSRYRVIHSVAFSQHTDEMNSPEFDLHWHLLPETCYADDTEDVLWQAAVPTKVGEADTLALNPSDLLLHTCLHGTKWDEDYSLRWAADAWMILAKAEIDWDRVVRLAKLYRMSLLLESTLRYLRDVLEAPIPEAALQALANGQHTRFERIEYQARARHRTKWYIPDDIFRYLRLYPHQSWLAALWNFPRYLQLSFGVAHRWQVIGFAINVLKNRLQSRLTSRQKAHREIQEQS